MNSASPFATIHQPGEEAICRVVCQLEQAGLQVVRTFDLQGAGLVQPDCPCPRHGTQGCDCRISVLLVYQDDQPPASVLVHSFQETTWLYLVETPGQPVSRSLDLVIRESLARVESGPKAPWGRVVEPRDSP